MGHEFLIVQAMARCPIVKQAIIKQACAAVGAYYGGSRKSRIPWQREGGIFCLEVSGSQPQPGLRPGQGSLL